MSAYTTVQRLRASIGSLVSGASDEVLTRVIEAVSQWIDQYCNRPDGFVALSTAAAREYAGSGEATMLIDECVQVTLVESKQATDTSYTAWVAADWRAYSGDARSPNLNRKPYHALMCLPSGSYSSFPRAVGRERAGFKTTLDDGLMTRQWSAPTVRVTGKWGYAVTLPTAIEEACIIQATRQYKRGQSAYNDATASAEFGVLQFRGLDPAVETILAQGRFIRPRI
ncbi:MAG: hypothetical protein L6Q98_19870 [Anaerolineae bacterium]|nr:hypothetical protein [Anaerolineae bacterium]NUQ06717.1 hypothetical protein [Anaerolineae bacterium]